MNVTEKLSSFEIDTRGWLGAREEKRRGARCHNAFLHLRGLALKPPLRTSSWLDGLHHINSSRLPYWYRDHDGEEWG